ncbi:hypothetical protein LJR084_002058 [Variovorax sp. LjRoot84]|uniref:hypothetical protein n=1 Tax=Variovorax sp. LjRoot84 TaxID=3342340 RepID=UPI003ECF3D81
MQFDLEGSEGLFPFAPPDPFPFPPPFPEPGPRWPPDRFFPPRELEQIRWPIKYGPAQVNILVVIDSGGAYDVATDFGLGIMLRDAFNVGMPGGTPLPADHPAYARFAFTLAHRSNGAGTTPGFDSFTFSDAKLAPFHEVWLFGISASAPYLQGAELAALTKFMDNGGGVLAMGDHEDLGLGLCGNVPRVKSMRKWWFDAPLPPGELKAPDSTDLTRNDTVQLIAGIDPGFGGQSDSTPQPIYPSYRYGHNWWRPWRRYRYPHPVLCGPRGAITVFPDHPHEGDCIAPAALDPAQYPGGVAPEVIARGRNVVGRTKGGYTITDPRQFGLLGAYDGHRPAAGVGRVLVDSTWHHWFNINLIGLDNVPHTTAYKDILAFFRNVAVWLAPRERQKRMRLTGHVLGLFTPYMIERTLTVRDLRPEMFYPIGIEARDALGRIAPQCQVDIWLFELLAPHLPLLRRRIEPPVPGELPDPWESLVLDRVAMTALGGAMASLALAARESDYRDGDAVIKSAEKIIDNGLREGLAYAEKDLAMMGKRLDAAVGSALLPKKKVDKKPKKK